MLMNDDPFNVIVHRLPHLPDLLYGERDEQQARYRVQALVDLHNCRWSREQNTFHVWAADYYKDVKVIS
jgi:hypothetical protein